MRLFFPRLSGLLSVLAVALLTQGCLSDADTIVQLKDHEYLPLQNGRYWEYDISESIYTNGPEGENRRYQLRTEVVDSIASISGYYAYVIERFTRADASAPWSVLDTWSVTFTDREAIVQEGNTSYVKLVLPIQPGLSWNGNTYNSLGDEQYTITQQGFTYVNADFNFADAIEVTHRDEVDVIVGKDVRREIYARGVGLVQRTQETVTYCSREGVCEIGTQEIESGVVREQVLIGYGKK